MSEANTKKHLLTVLLEDYFHVGAFNSIIQHGQWYRFETRFEKNTLKALDLLDSFDIKATFFSLGWIADNNPEIIREIARRGHEIANRGYYHRSIKQMTPEEFREDLKRSREALEKASGKKIVGYRSAEKLSYSSDLWTLDVLAEEGYSYDASFLPTSRTARQESWRRFAHKHQTNEREIWEFPYSTAKVGGLIIPIAGGNYFRQIPHTLLKYAVKNWNDKTDAPFVMYFHVWELDPEQPRISAASRITRIRHYRKLDKMEWVLKEYFSKYKFVGAAEYLGVETEVSSFKFQVSSSELQESELKIQDSRFKIQDSRLKAQDEHSALRTPHPALEKSAITIVIPCYNEELVLPYLANTLRSVEATLEKDYDLRFIFVDDCSTDKTWESLHQLFSEKENVKFMRHRTNMGVAAGILTGLRNAETEIVCSMDCDCTYDPHELQNMIPLLTDDVDMVTASPYHPQGGVRNVPTWRLSLSKGASFLYGKVLKQKLHTYTSCFRVYRRSAVADLNVKENGFLGVAETLGQLDLRGGKIVEHPAMLEVRLFGWSKMKVARTIAGHLKLLLRLLAMRISGKEKRKAIESKTRKQLSVSTQK
jgi:polysaccharide deacetylase family protein (PEP-CTERM system associated)